MNHLNIPFIPDTAVKLAVLDYRADKEIVNSLKQEGIDNIMTVPCYDLYDAINGHPDIIMHHIGNNKIVLAPNIYEKLEVVFLKKGFALTKGNTWLSRNYPGNIAYNVLRIGSMAFHNTKYTDKKIIEKFEENNIELIHVNQGYTKCSVCVLDENTVITADYKMAKIFDKKEIECLLIKPGGIILENMSYGFIGGATGLISKRTLALTGDFLERDTHNKKLIFNFLEQKGIAVKILSKKQIVDIGSIIPISC